MHKHNREFLTVFHMDMNHVSLREDYIRTWLGRLAGMGYNAILWELEDKVRWETCPHAVWPEAMDKDKFRSILDYSRELGLEPIPLLQTIGHAEYILKHDSYAHMREQEDRYDCYCTSNPAVRIFQKELIAEYLDLFREVNHFHLGGDEAYVFASCPTCKTLAEETCRNKIYAEYIMDIAGSIFDRNIRPGIWCDMILRHPEDVEFIPRELSIWDWNYWDGVGEPEKAHVWGLSYFPSKESLTEDTIRKLPEIVDDQGKLRGFYTVDVLQRLKYDLFLCSTIRSAGDTVFCGKHKLHSENVAGAAKKAIESKLLGHCVTSWAVRIHSLETQQAWIRMASECNINPNKSCEEIITKCGHDLLGIEPREFYDAIDNIALGIPFIISCHDHGSAIQWTGMKDSMPPPKGFIKSVLENWKNEGDGKTYDQRKSMLDDAEPKIIKGKAALEALTDKLPDAPNHDFLNYWLEVADFQVRMIDIAKTIFQRFEEDNSAVDIKTVDELNQIRADCHSWMLNWMTPKSARLNSDLIFKPLIEYFE